MSDPLPGAMFILFGAFLLLALIGVLVIIPALWERFVNKPETPEEAAVLNQAGGVISSELHLGATTDESKNRTAL